jgi:integrase/recombinase XerC
VSLDTTNHYARANLETKRQALAKGGYIYTSVEAASLETGSGPAAWLNSLQRLVAK